MHQFAVFFASSFVGLHFLVCLSGSSSRNFSPHLTTFVSRVPWAAQEVLHHLIMFHVDWAQNPPHWTRHLVGGQFPHQLLGFRPSEVAHCCNAHYFLHSSFATCLHVVLLCLWATSASLKFQWPDFSRHCWWCPPRSCSSKNVSFRATQMGYVYSSRATCPVIAACLPLSHSVCAFCLWNISLSHDGDHRMINPMTVSQLHP